MPAKWNIWSSEGVKATQSIWGTYVKIGWNVIRAAALRLDRWHTLPPPVELFINVIILNHMDPILTASFGNVDYGTFHIAAGLRYCTDKLSGCVICRSINGMNPRIERSFIFSGKTVLITSKCRATFRGLSIKRNHEKRGWGLKELCSKMASLALISCDSVH